MNVDKEFSGSYAVLNILNVFYFTSTFSIPAMISSIMIVIPFNFISGQIFAQTFPDPKTFMKVYIRT